MKPFQDHPTSTEEIPEKLLRSQDYDNNHKTICLLGCTIFLTCRVTVASSNWFGILLGFDLMHRMKNGFACGMFCCSVSVFKVDYTTYLMHTWLSVSIKAISEFWNCAVTVSGCFLVFTDVWLLIRFWPAVRVFTDWRFFRPFFGLSRGLNDLFFLRNDEHRLTSIHDT